MKKIVSLIKILIIFLLVILTIKLIAYDLKSGVLAANPYSDTGKLQHWIETKKDDYLSLDSKTLVKRSYQFGGSADGRSHIMCLQHGENNKTDVAYDIVNVLDLYFDESTGKYCYRNTIKGKNNIQTGEHDIAGKLAYAIGYHDLDAPAEELVSPWCDANVTIGTYLYNMINDGIINAHDSFPNYNWTAIASGGEDASLDQKASQYINEVSNYRNITKKKASESMKLEKSGSKYIVGPLRISYGSKGVNSIKLIGDSKNINATFRWSFQKSNWKEIIGNIQSERDFYIEITTNSNLDNYKKVELEFTQDSIPVYTARMLMAYAPEGAQQLGFVGGKIENYKAKISYIIHEGSGGGGGETTPTPTPTPTTPTPTPTTTLGKIIINKTDYDDTSTKLEADFLIYYRKTENNSWRWLSTSGKEGETLETNQTGPYKYNNTYRTNATIYRTKGGSIKLENLEYGFYRVYEVTAPSGYTLSEQTGISTQGGANYAKDEDDGWERVRCAGFELNNNNKSETVNMKNKVRGSITLSKVDADNTNTKLSGAVFKLYRQGKGWISKTATDSNYITGENNYNNANVATYTTGTDGKVKISNLPLGKYDVWETSGPANHTISNQTGYVQNKGVLVKTVEVTLNQKNPDIGDIKNVEDKISISGYVWEERTINNKKTEYDDLYKTGDIRIKGITVKLKPKAGKTGSTFTTTTDANGNYTFSNVIKRNQLSDYYVEFDYRGTTYKQHIPAKFNKNIANGSKAIVNTMPENDKDYIGIATTYTGTDKESEYGLSSISFNTSTNTVENVNLGLKPLPGVNYTASEEIESVRIVMNGYTFTYNYTKPARTGSPNAPRVHFQSTTNNTIKGYTQPIYPSYIEHNYRNGTNNNDLQVYVKYRIYIQNTTNITSDNTYDYLYVEKALHVSSLSNEFDTNRYELNDSNWTTNANKPGTAVYKNPTSIKNENAVNGAGIAGGQTGTATIEFKVKNDEIYEELHSIQDTVSKASNSLPTKAIVNAYHQYTRKDYSWSNLQNSNQIYKDQTHIRDDEEKTPTAPYIIFVIENEREIRGKIFEDKVDESKRANTGEALGNGRLDDGEKGAKDVKVELLNTDGSNAKLYDIKYEFDNRNRPLRIINSQTKDAITVSSDSGEYSLKGIVPGEYFLRFTYGNGNYKITDLNGSELTSGSFDTNVENADIKADEYKSTIVTSGKVKDAIENGSSVASRQHLWYKSLEETNYSVAVDDLENRKEVTNGQGENVKANSPVLSVTLENLIESEEDIDNILSGGKKSHITEGLNFGIIRQPEQRLKTDKIITEVKLTNAQNNTIFMGNPEKDLMSGVSDLDDTKNGGSKYTRAEIAEESIYGSTLDIRYKIEVTNVSDVNYYGANYYKYGDATGAKEVTVKINTVTDHLDKNLMYISSYDSENRKTKEITKGETTEDGKKITELEIKNWGTLYTNKKSRQSNEPTSESVDVIAQRILTTQDDDLEVKNTAWVSGAERIADDTIKKSVDLGEKATAVMTVIPPTGKDKQITIIYAVAAGVSLTILAIGIVILKKRILKD